MKKAIVIGGSRGIGRSIASSLRSINCQVIQTSRNDIDTSDLQSVKKFVAQQKYTDIIVLNTGGPPAKSFFDITEHEWNLYHNQLFLSFCLILQKLKINDGGYIFLISSDVMKEPNPDLVLSSSYRLAFTSVLKILSKEYASRNINCINIAPGAIDTDRVHQLGIDTKKMTSSLPMRRMGKPEEIGNFVAAIIEKEIKYLSGVVINFDGANSNYVL
ncbi:Short-chain dehydrogenase/reductase SDR [Nitrosotalea devaniterrae]|uniref:Short-chain dehydrogenase/reductase SDR n=1 Tax=Nitrosotalea devaniterrae TaxID=1078905 RepID=A0A128A0T3_9ARCH|nr:Short-chain dehydrogenase/reductase SDR [Candidatus Nitrosotalea devanaterra]